MNKVWIRDGGRHYHYDGCPMLENNERDIHYYQVTKAEAVKRDYWPCSCSAQPD